MSAPEFITTQIRAYLGEFVVPVLPTEVRVLSFDVVSWLVTVHTYQHEMLSDQTDSQLEQRIEGLADALPPRLGEAWQVVPSYHRSEPLQPIRPEGEVVYAV
jgi:hypothetical protein